MATNDGKRYENGDSPWKNEELLRELYSKCGLSMDRIAERFGCSSGTINYWINKFGIDTRSRSEAGIGAGRVERTGFRTDRKGYEIAYAYTRQGGRAMEQVQIHRLVAVAEYGFEVVNDNVIHHINEITWDNRPSNLRPMPRDEHTIRHHSRWSGGDVDV